MPTWSNRPIAAPRPRAPWRRCAGSCGPSFESMRAGSSPPDGHARGVASAGGDSLVDALRDLLIVEIAGDAVLVVGPVVDGVVILDCPAGVEVLRGQRIERHH